MRNARIAVTMTIGALFGVSGLAHAQSADDTAYRALYKELIETNTTLSVGSCTAAEQKMAARLKTAGYTDADMHIYAPDDRPKDSALVVTLPGTDSKLKPILLLAHVDVVEAKREDWTRDPFTLVEEGGYFYARGASDDKAMASVFTDSMIRYKQEGFKPRRGIKLALTCGEETPESFNSVYWLMTTQPKVLDAAFALNEGAAGELDEHGKPRALQIQAGEKVYQDFTLETTNRGGHSSRPVPDNAIYELAAGLLKLSAYHFPIALNDATRGYFKALTQLVEPQLAADMQAVLDHADEKAAARLWAIDPAWNSMMRTTCVATMLDGGHAPNALPQRATANVNCRILPGVSIADVQKTLGEVVGDKITITAKPEPSTGVGALPPLTDKMIGPVKTLAAEMWPGAAIVPTMQPGATDSRFLNSAGIPSYGLSGMFFDAEGSHMHGLNERIAVKSLMDGRRFLYEIVKIYANQK